jgi:hypothetical protein
MKRSSLVSGIITIGIILAAAIALTSSWQRRNMYKIVRATNACRFYLEKAIEYRKFHGKYPETLEIILAGLAPDVAARIRSDHDAWGQPYGYQIVKDKPCAFTLGMDGVPGGWGQDADIVYTVVGDEIVSGADWPVHVR